MCGSGIKRFFTAVQPGTFGDEIKSNSNKNKKFNARKKYFSTNVGDKNEYISL